MQPVTLRDVSREAGVSLATADRVMNGRAGVRQVTVARVREASERLGYRANHFASRLARGGQHRLTFVLPRGSNPFMRALSDQIMQAGAHFAAQRVSVALVQVNAFDPTAQAEALDQLCEQGCDGVAVVALEHPMVHGAIDSLTAAGIPVVTLVSDAPGSRRAHYVGIDNLAAGRTAGTLLGRFAGPRAGRVGVVLGSTALRDHADRLHGFAEVLARDFPTLDILPARAGHDDDETSERVAASLLEAHADLVGLYAAGAGTAGIAGALHKSGRERDVVLIGHELNDAACAWLRRGTVDALIHQDAGHEARSAVRLLLARLTGEPVLVDQERIRIEIFLRDNLP
jgi:LacI family transcriptional regulator